MFQATRYRLALWYAIVTAVLLLLFATGVYMYVRNTLIERVDDTLNHVVEVVTRSLVIEPAYTQNKEWRLNVEASFQDNTDTVEDDHIDLEWFSPTGELLRSTFSMPLDIPLHPNRTGETVREANSSVLLRQITERVEIGQQVLGYLRVSHPWFEVTKPSRQLIVDLSLGTSAMAISVAAIGWWLSGLAMKPVKESYQRLKQFTADASHELRNPVATIQTNVQVALADPNPLPALQRQQLQVVERLTRRLGNLVDDLLFLARQDSALARSKMASVPLDALAIEVIEEQRLVAAAKGIDILVEIVNPPDRIDPVEEIFTIEGDWEQLARLFTNLIGNAVKYTPMPQTETDKAEVRVQLQRLGRPRHDYLQVKISDRGIGIPEDALPHLFDRFYRVDPSRAKKEREKEKNTGSGLGLAIAAAIVENHQGQIHIESQIDRGTTVTVTLPDRSKVA
ncbi:MAG: HAMP domain-containing histidine kinase [Cyanosarcina radialis HA8281-LM2]|jgi:OmpR-family two-component system manganese-sensing sensor histidine kinase|nr:HAMP domain-containing histidine kinase [Cyanosarcina radialis HA8281-LM2]